MTGKVSPLIAQSGRPLLHRWLTIAGLAVLFLLLTWHFALLLSYIRFALSYPFQLDYGEGIVWQQARNIWAGKGYAPLQLFPAIVYHYPPVYHLTFEALAALTGMDEMSAGRLVSILSSAVTALFVAMLASAVVGTAQNGKTRAICGVFASLLFLSCFPVRMWTPLMRVDMLAGALGIAGLWFALQALSRPNRIYVASAMFVLGMFVKQISIAPPAAVFLVLLFTHRPLALRGIAAAMAMGLAGLGVEQWLNGGEFLRHIVGYNVNRIDPSLLRDILAPQLLMHAAIIALGLAGAVGGWRHVRGVAGSGTIAHRCRGIASDQKAVLILILLLFGVLKTLMLLAMLKSGANYNYMVEWLCGFAIFAGATIAPYVAFSRGQGAPARSLLMTALVFVALPAQLIALFGLYAGQPEFSMIDGLRRDKQPIVDMIAASGRPVIADDMTFPIRAGRQVEWEAAITAELGAKGVYDQAGFARLIRAHCFGFFVIDGILGTAPSAQLYDPIVISAIRQAYPGTQTISKYTLHLPEAPADPSVCASVS